MLRRWKLDVINIFYFPFQGTRLQEKTFSNFALLKFENSHFISYERKPLTQPLLKFSLALDQEVRYLAGTYFCFKGQGKLVETFSVIFPWFTTRKIIETCQKQFWFHGNKFNLLKICMDWNIIDIIENFYQYSLIFQGFYVCQHPCINTVRTFRPFTCI